MLNVTDDFLETMDIGLGAAVALLDLVVVPADQEDPGSIQDCMGEVRYASQELKEELKRRRSLGLKPHIILKPQHVDAMKENYFITDLAYCDVEGNLDVFTSEDAAYKLMEAMQYEGMVTRLPLLDEAETPRVKVTPAKEYIVEKVVIGLDGYFDVVIKGETHVNRTRIRSNEQFFSTRPGYDFSHSAIDAEERATAIAYGLNQLQIIKAKKQLRIV